MHKVQWEGRGRGGVKGLKRVAREGVWWVQPVSSSPPPVPDSRQNGLVDPCHRKRVSLTRNLDPGGRESEMIESGKRIVYSRLIRVITSNERRIFVVWIIVPFHPWTTFLKIIRFQSKSFNSIFGNSMLIYTTSSIIRNNLRKVYRTINLSAVKLIFRWLKIGWSD